MWQIQGIPTPQMWVPPLEDEDPVENLSTFSSSTPSTDWAYIITDASISPVESLGTLAGTQSTADGDTFISQTGSESLATLAGTQQTADGATFTFQSGSESLATLAGTQTTADAFVWTEQSGGDSMATLAGDPTTNWAVA